jgi:hypothetical protein
MAAAGGAFFQPAAVFERPFYLGGKLGVNVAKGVYHDKIDIRFRYRSFAGKAGEKNLKNHIDDFENLVSHGQIGRVDKIYPQIALIRPDDFGD